jgi:hypothetical protein
MPISGCARNGRLRLNVCHAGGWRALSDKAGPRAQVKKITPSNKQLGVKLPTHTSGLSTGLGRGRDWGPVRLLG